MVLTSLNNAVGTCADEMIIASTEPGSPLKEISVLEETSNENNITAAPKKKSGSGREEQDSNAPKTLLQASSSTNNKNRDGDLQRSSLERIRKRVRFSEKVEIVPLAAIPSSSPSSDNGKEQRGAESGCASEQEPSRSTSDANWFTRDEVLEMQRQALYAAEFCLRCRPEYHESAILLLSNCAKTEATTTTKKLQHRSSNDLDDSCVSNYDNSDGNCSVSTSSSTCTTTGDLSVTAFPSILSFLATSARGLELTIFPMLQQRRVRVVQTVLQTQGRLRRKQQLHVCYGTGDENYGGGGALGSDLEQRWHLISQQYRRQSRYAVSWSRLMAEGDAMLCRDYDDDDCNGNPFKNGR